MPNTQSSEKMPVCYLQVSWYDTSHLSNAIWNWGKRKICGRLSQFWFLLLFIFRVFVFAEVEYVSVKMSTAFPLSVVWTKTCKIFGSWISAGMVEGYTGLSNWGVDGCWEESHYSSGLWLLVGCPCSSGWTQTHEHVARMRFNNLINSLIKGTWSWEEDTFGHFQDSLG